MDMSLDDYIQDNKKNSDQGMKMSLDEYIFQNNVGKPRKKYNQSHNNESHEDSGVSKFDRYKHQDEDDDDFDDDGLPKQMPKLVLYEIKTMPPKTKAIHQRLGDKRGSVCESIHTSQMKLFRPKFKVKQSVQSRLGKNYVNPAVIERNRIAVHAMNTYAKSAANRLASTDDVQGQLLINAFARAIQYESKPEQKYDMGIQKEISTIQGKELYYSCPGGLIISSDGPGLNNMTKLPTHNTGMSLNQRFA